MAGSVDGRIDAGDWPVAAEVRREYELVHDSYDADGWICGRITMEPFAKGLRTPEQLACEFTGREPRDDFRAAGDFESFAFAIDPSGKLAWESNDIGGDHVVAIVTQRVSHEYLTFLRDRCVSYIIAGARDVDLPLALEKIGKQFGVKTLMLEGGGRINGGMLRAGLVDEVSVLVAPTVDGRIGTPAVFDVDGDEVTPARLTLAGVEQRAGGVVWLRYTVEQAG